MRPRFLFAVPLGCLILGGCQGAVESTSPGVAPVPVSQLPRHKHLAEVESAAKAVLLAPAPTLDELNSSTGVSFPAPAPTTLAGHYLTFLKPNKPKRSLLVLEPLGAGKDSFFPGCARWMKLHGAGSTALDSGTTWGMADDVRRSSNWDSLALERGRALQLARGLDAASVAIGSVQNGALVYEVLDAAVMPSRVVGTFTLRGTKAQIIAGLPGLTRQIVGAAGARSAAISANVGLGDADLAFLGSLPFHPSLKSPVSSAQRAHLAQLANIPLAAMFLARLSSTNRPALESGARALLKMAPTNAAAAVELVNYGGVETARITDCLRVLDSKYPRHLCVALGNAALRGDERDYFAQVHYAELAVRSAPDSAYAWYTLSEAIGDQADERRQGKYYLDMSRDEKADVEKMYPRALVAAWKATQLQPGDSIYWKNLSSASTFGDNPHWALEALTQSLRLDPHNEDALNWGLQIFQPKWFGDAASFAKMARIAVENARSNNLDAESLCDGLDKTNQQALKRPLLEILLRHEPNNLYGLINYSYARRMDTGSSVASYPLAKRALQLAPDNIDALQELGDIEQHDRAEYTQAIAHMGRAASLDPQNGVLWVNLALPYAKSGQKAEALKFALKGHALGYNGPHPAWNLVGLGPDGSAVKVVPNVTARPASP